MIHLAKYQQNIMRNLINKIVNTLINFRLKTHLNIMDSHNRMHKKQSRKKTPHLKVLIEMVHATLTSVKV